VKWAEEKAIKTENFFQLVFNRDFGALIRKWLRACLGGYIELIAVEILGLMIIIYNDLEILTAWFCLQAIMMTMQLFTMGVSDSIQYFCTEFINSGNSDGAKRVSVFCLKYSLLVGFIFTIIVTLTSRELAGIFVHAS
jgi:Na+-driven multidrug efflux pump